MVDTGDTAIDKIFTLWESALHKSVEAHVFEPSFEGLSDEQLGRMVRRVAYSTLNYGQEYTRAHATFLRQIVIASEKLPDNRSTINELESLPDPLFHEYVALSAELDYNPEVTSEAFNTRVPDSSSVATVQVVAYMSAHQLETGYRAIIDQLDEPSLNTQQREEIEKTIASLSAHLSTIGRRGWMDNATLFDLTLSHSNLTAIAKADREARPLAEVETDIQLVFDRIFGTNRTEFAQNLSHQVKIQSKRHLGR